MRISLTACLAAALMTQAGAAGACTVFAAAGPELVPSGGTLVGKVRDERPAKQIVKTVASGDGYAFVGLFVGDNERYNMGVNEKGLVVFRTTAGSIPKKVRSRSVRYKSPAGLSGHEQIIRHCATVEEALKSGVFLEPTNYVIADRKKIAYVEVLPDGTHASRVYDRGRFAHTNHYLMPEHQAAVIETGMDHFGRSWTNRRSPTAWRTSSPGPRTVMTVRTTASSASAFPARAARPRSPPWSFTFRPRATPRSIFAGGRTPQLKT